MPRVVKTGKPLSRKEKKEKDTADMIKRREERKLAASALREDDSTTFTHKQIKEAAVRVMKSQNLSQKEFGKAVGVSTATVSNWINGVRLNADKVPEYDEKVISWLSHTGNMNFIQTISESEEASKTQEWEAQGWKISGHPYITKQVLRTFEMKRGKRGSVTEKHTGEVVFWLPAGKGVEEPELFKVQHHDGDVEDLEKWEVEKGIKLLETESNKEKNKELDKLTPTPSSPHDKPLHGKRPAAHSISDEESDYLPGQNDDPSSEDEDDPSSEDDKGVKGVKQRSRKKTKTDPEQQQKIPQPTALGPAFIRALEVSAFCQETQSFVRHLLLTTKQRVVPLDKAIEIVKHLIKEFSSSFREEGELLFFIEDVVTKRVSFANECNQSCKRTNIEQLYTKFHSNEQNLIPFLTGLNSQFDGLQGKICEKRLMLLDTKTTSLLAAHNIRNAFDALSVLYVFVVHGIMYFPPEKRMMLVEGRRVTVMQEEGQKKSTTVHFHALSTLWDSFTGIFSHFTDWMDSCFERCSNVGIHAVIPNFSTLDLSSSKECTGYTVEDLMSAMQKELCSPQSHLSEEESLLYTMDPFLGRIFKIIFSIEGLKACGTRRFLVPISRLLEFIFLLNQIVTGVLGDTTLNPYSMEFPRQGDYLKRNFRGDKLCFSEVEYSFESSLEAIPSVSHVERSGDLLHLTGYILNHLHDLFREMKFLSQLEGGIDLLQRGESLCTLLITINTANCNTRPELDCNVKNMVNILSNEPRCKFFHEMWRKDQEKLDEEDEDEDSESSESSDSTKSSHSSGAPASQNAETVQ